MLDRGGALVPVVRSITRLCGGVVGETRCERLLHEVTVGTWSSKRSLQMRPAIVARVRERDTHPHDQEGGTGRGSITAGRMGRAIVL